jgi:hypothetical protein
VATVAGFTASPLNIEQSDGEDYADGMSEQDAIRFRKQANEAREQASKAISPLDKETWLRIAEEWLRLAASADGRK